MRHIAALLLFFLLTSCAAPAGEDVPDPAENTLPAEAAEPEDHVLLTLEAPLVDGRTLVLEAVGKVLDRYACGVRQVRVYDGDALIQTVLTREAIEDFWDGKDLLPGEEPSSYTSCWEPEGSMEVLDLNFDGNTDFDLFGWTANNTIPYYYWMWDKAAEQYRCAFTLQGAAAHPETKELTSEYKSGSAGSQWIVEYYRPDRNGELYLDRVERDTCDFQPESGCPDYDRSWTHEVWTPPETIAPIRSGNDRWSVERDLVPIRREVPLYEINADNTVTCYTEIWELKDGKFQMASREEFFYDDQQ